LNLVKDCLDTIIAKKLNHISMFLLNGCYISSGVTPLPAFGTILFNSLSDFFCGRRITWPDSFIINSTLSPVVRFYFLLIFPGRVIWPMLVIVEVIEELYRWRRSARRQISKLEFDIHKKADH